jgi:hypothetical protein
LDAGIALNVNAETPTTMQYRQLVYAWVILLRRLSRMAVQERLNVGKRDAIDATTLEPNSTQI